MTSLRYASLRILIKVFYCVVLSLLKLSILSSAHRLLIQVISTINFLDACQTQSHQKQGRVVRNGVPAMQPSHELSFQYAFILTRVHCASLDILILILSEGI